MEAEIQRIVEYFKNNLEGREKDYKEEVQRTKDQWNEKAGAPCYLMEIAYNVQQNKLQELLYDAVFEVAYEEHIFYISVQGKTRAQDNHKSITRVARVYPKKIVREIYIEKGK